MLFMSDKIRRPQIAAHKSVSTPTTVAPLVLVTETLNGMILLSVTVIVKALYEGRRLIQGEELKPKWRTHWVNERSLGTSSFAVIVFLIQILKRTPCMAVTWHFCKELKRQPIVIGTATHLNVAFQRIHKLP